MRKALALLALGSVCTLLSWHEWGRDAAAQEGKKEKDKAGPERGSIVEDRTARKLIEAGEPATALKVWQSATNT